MNIINRLSQPDAARLARVHSSFLSLTQAKVYRQFVDTSVKVENNRVPNKNSRDAVSRAAGERIKKLLLHVNSTKLANLVKIESSVSPIVQTPLILLLQYVSPHLEELILGDA